MTAPHADQLIEGYLARVSAAASDFPTAARNELLDDIRAHIVEARSREVDETDATILNILDRLGEPSVVVGEARERLGLEKAPPPSRPGLVEIAAVVLLPFIWVAGVILLWWSTAWRVRDKIIGTIFSLGGYPTVLIIGTFAAHGVLGGVSTSCGGGVDSNGNVVQTVCTGPSVIDVVGAILSGGFVVLIFLLPVMTAVYLVIRLRSGQRLGPRAA